MAIKYTVGADSSGWLMVRYKDNNSTYPPLPQYTKVDLTKTENKRDYFKILEGGNINREASVSRTSAGTSYLTDSSHDPAGKVFYNRKKGELWWGKMDRTKSGIGCKIYPSNPPPLGVHDLEIPYEVHGLGSAYLAISPFATTWFRIGPSGDRFLHPGSVSLGCVTVNEVNEWDGIYAYLIDRRKGDKKSVGTINIFE
jgi:hypothetical protein